MRVFVGGPIYPMGGTSNASVDALAIEGGRILATGAAARERLGTTPAQDVTDLGGRALVPGFVDPHHHISIAALYRGTADCRANRLSSLDEIVAELRQVAARLPAGQWVVGWGYDERRLADRRHPTRHDLDRASLAHPILLVHYSFHSCVTNTRGLEVAGIGRETRDPPAGRIDRGRRGEPTGRLLETAMAPLEATVERFLLQQDTVDHAARIARYEDELFEAGITRIGDPSVSRTQELRFRQMHAEGRLRVPLSMFPCAESGYLLPPTDRLQDAPTGTGPEDLRVGPMKLYLDGGHACAMCMTLPRAAGTLVRAMVQSLRRRTLAPFGFLSGARGRLGPDLRVRTGIRYYADFEASRIMARAAVDRDFSIAIHAMGNEAVVEALEALRAVRRDHRDVPPPRIEHAAFLDAELARRAADTGVALVMQPGHLAVSKDGQLPPIPGLRAFAVESARRAGALVALSSDAPTAPFDPLFAIRAGRLRRNADGVPVHPEEAVEVLDLLQMHTRNAAWSLGCGDVTGTLEAGKRADLVVLSRDPGAVRNSSDLDALRVDETVLGGKTVFRRCASPPGQKHD